MWILILLLIPLLLAGLWILALRGKRSSGDFHGLARYHYAHRGLHSKKASVPENSLLAFRRAVEQGYGAELDVHLSKDGRLVVIHDESLLRTAGVDRKVCDCTARELRGYFLEETGEPIPFLEEVLPMFAGQTPLVVELKPHAKNHAALAEATCKLLDQYPQLQYCIESFDPRALLWLKKNRPEIIRGQLASNFMKDRSGLSAPLAFFLTNLMCNFLTVPHFVAYRFSDRRNLSLRLCRKLWGVQEFSWTVNSPRRAKKLRREGSILIFEDFIPEKE
ncbi:MAG: glycerophosphodiester phosphodiesterase [Oscillospiraceae bacterium]|nr:glycerophosphodiester phosphodiesterase [Oscillospiraceae bacterium]